MGHDKDASYKQTIGYLRAIRLFVSQAFDCSLWMWMTVQDNWNKKCKFISMQLKLNKKNF